jgi:hypothetical protein
MFVENPSAAIKTRPKPIHVLVLLATVSNVLAGFDFIKAETCALLRFAG